MRLNRTDRNVRRVPTRFGSDCRFEINAVPAVPFRAQEDTRLEQLKYRLLNERLRDAWEPRLLSPMRRAANDAAAVAWTTPYPLLVFPALFEEKADEMLVHLERQESILRRSRELLPV